MDDISANSEINCLLDLIRQYKKTLGSQQTKNQQQRKCSCDSSVNAASSVSNQCGKQRKVATNESNNTGCDIRRVCMEPSEIRLTLKLDTWMSDTGTLVIRPSICGDASAGDSSAAQQAILVPVNAVQCGIDKSTEKSSTAAAPTHPHLVQQHQLQASGRLRDHLQRPDRGLSTGVATSTARPSEQDDSQTNNHHDSVWDQLPVQSDSLTSKSGSFLDMATISISPDADCDTSAQPQDQDRIVTSTVALIHRLHAIIKSDAAAAGMNPLDPLAH